MCTLQVVQTIWTVLRMLAKSCGNELTAEIITFPILFPPVYWYQKLRRSQCDSGLLTNIHNCVPSLCQETYWCH